MAVLRVQPVMHAAIPVSPSQTDQHALETRQRAKLSHRLQISKFCKKPSVVQDTAKANKRAKNAFVFMLIGSLALGIVLFFLVESGVLLAISAFAFLVSLILSIQALRNKPNRKSRRLAILSLIVSSIYFLFWAYLIISLLFYLF
ncbi:MAG: hypothetical protein JNJ57_14320 [Saprospiraceae bacterium]|nr:hypothetical protein [Saprospiraceae bacterium]